MKIKLSAGFSGVISTGSYENARPSYLVEIELDREDVEVQPFEEFVSDRLAKLQDICQQRFQADEQRLIVDRITRERSDLRFYDGLPSVTSIINWDADFFVTPQDLQQYASQGNLYHAQVEHFIKTGEWTPAGEIEGTWADIVILKKGSLGLTYDDWQFPAFLKKYPVEKMEQGCTVKSVKHAFAGTSDIRVCYYDGKKTLADVKRTPDKLKHFKQCAAYILAEEEMGESPAYEQMMLIPANGKTEQGFSKPVLSTEIAQYKGMFLKDREAFKKRFGI